MKDIGNSSYFYIFVSSSKLVLSVQMSELRASQIVKLRSIKNQEEDWVTETQDGIFHKSVPVVAPEKKPNLQIYKSWIHKSQLYLVTGYKITY